VIQTFTQRHNEMFREFNQALLQQTQQSLEAERARANEATGRADKLSHDLHSLQTKVVQFETSTDNSAALFKEAQSERVLISRENERLSKEMEQLARQKERLRKRVEKLTRENEVLRGEKGAMRAAVKPVLELLANDE
jgi:chromosome segregation ATPase